jgi:hypothetical protein
MNTTTEPKTRRKRHWFVLVLRALGVLILLVVASYFVADQIAYRSCQAQLERFRAQFGKATFEEFIPERPPADEDAGRVYRYAAGLMAEVNARLGDWSMYHAIVDGPESFERRGSGGDPLPTDDELARKVQEKMEAMAEAFAAVEEARTLTAGTYLEDYSFDGSQMEPLSEVREVARNIAAKAVFEARAGNLEEACKWLESGVHLAATSNKEPTLLAGMVRLALIDLAADSAEAVFETTAVAPPLSTRYWELLDGVSNPDVYANTLASDNAFALSVKIPFPRLILSLNHIRMMESYALMAEAVRMDRTAERLQRIDAASEHMAAGPYQLYALVQTLAPAIARNVAAYDEMAVRCDFVRIAHALRTFKQNTDSYPDVLETIAPQMSGPLPLDPFSGGALHYQRVGEGFTLYSIGQDRSDDGGTAGTRGKGDLVWTTTR